MALKIRHLTWRLQTPRQGWLAQHFQPPEGNLDCLLWAESEQSIFLGEFRGGVEAFARRDGAGRATPTSVLITKSRAFWFLRRTQLESDSPKSAGFAALA